MVNILEKCSISLPSSCIFDRCRFTDRYNKRDTQSSPGYYLGATPAQHEFTPSLPANVSKKLLRARCEQEAYNHPRRTSLDQALSTLLSRVPIEIRMIIYRNVLCVPVPVVHIVKRKDGTLCHVRCRAADGECGTYRCYNDYSELSRMTSNVPFLHSKDGGPSGNLLALLLTCKKT